MKSYSTGAFSQIRYFFLTSAWDRGGGKFPNTRSDRGATIAFSNPSLPLASVIVLPFTVPKRWIPLCAPALDSSTSESESCGQHGPQVRGVSSVRPPTPFISIF
ncbi:hypothetical protein NPIL_135841 [Nephila pilipes]|uniref:Uncharacterized protein n=1 Tax=Nephila pilipes TaxID=299642 RepID=A0A8X6U9N3_NEPPI|nr:hypothetical protein NPIL_135841 [Nephila pilipes]